MVDDLDFNLLDTARQGRTLCNGATLTFWICMVLTILGLRLKIELVRGVQRTAKNL